MKEKNMLSLPWYYYLNNNLYFEHEPCAHGGVSIGGIDWPDRGLEWLKPTQALGRSWELAPPAVQPIYRLQELPQSHSPGPDDKHLAALHSTHLCFAGTKSWSSSNYATAGKNCSAPGNRNQGEEAYPTLPCSKTKTLKAMRIILAAAARGKSFQDFRVRCVHKGEMRTFQSAGGRTNQERGGMCNRRRWWLA